MNGSTVVNASYEFSHKQPYMNSRTWCNQEKMSF